MQLYLIDFIGYFKFAGKENQATLLPPASPALGARKLGGL